MSSRKTPGKKGAEDGDKTQQKSDKSTDDKGLAATRLRQTEFIAHYIKEQFHIGNACAKTGINRCTYYSWRDNDPEFQSRLHDAVELRLDGWERQLDKNIKSGSEASLIFGLKCHGKGRGYDEKQTTTAETVKILSEVLEEKLSVREAAYRFTMLGLPLPEVLKIELSKQEPEPPPPPDPPSEEEMNAKFEAAMKERTRQLEQFVPERQAEVDALKESLKGQSSFDKSEELDEFN